jgi:hypothetical protein
MFSPHLQNKRVVQNCGMNARSLNGPAVPSAIIHVLLAGCPAQIGEVVVASIAVVMARVSPWKLRRPTERKQY